MITDEPVRGRTPPPWFRALSGIVRFTDKGETTLNGVPDPRRIYAVAD